MNRRTMFLAAAVSAGTLGAPAAMAQDEAPAQLADGGGCCGHPEGSACGHQAKGWHGGQRPKLEIYATPRYLFSPSTVVLGEGFRLRHANGFALGWQNNLGIQLFPDAGNGHWLSAFGGLTPGYEATAGSVKLGAESLLGFGWMVRSMAPNDTLHGRAMWVAEPRLTALYKDDRWSAGVQGGYLFTPAPEDLGGFSLGLSFTWKGLGRLWGHPAHPSFHEGGEGDKGKGCSECRP